MNHDRPSLDPEPRSVDWPQLLDVARLVGVRVWHMDSRGTMRHVEPAPIGTPPDQAGRPSPDAEKQEN